MIDHRSYSTILNAVVKLKREKNSGLGNGFELMRAGVRITARINHFLISFSAVQIYVFSCIYLYSSPSTGILRTHNVISSQSA